MRVIPAIIMLAIFGSVVYYAHVVNKGRPLSLKANPFRSSVDRVAEAPVQK